MKIISHILAVLALAIVGCAAPLPFVGAERGAVYSLEEFEQALVAEKIAILKGELRQLQTSEPVSPEEVKLTPFVIPQFPRLSEWRKMKQKARPGDEIWEYHHRLYLKHYDGPDDAMRRGYALVRDGRRIAFVFVDSASPLDY